MNLQKKSICSLILLFTAFYSHSQLLMDIRNNPEYNCVPVKLISDFEKSNDFLLGDNTQIEVEQAHFKVAVETNNQGIENSKCLELQAEGLPGKGGTFFLECKQTVFVSEGEGIGLWFKSNRDLPTNIYFEDATGLVFYVPKKYIVGNTGWSYSYALPNAYRMPADAGRPNPEISFPCKFLGISFNPKEEATKIYIDEIAIVKEPDMHLLPEFSVKPQKTGNVYLLNETVNVNVASVANKLKVLFKDYNGNLIDEITGDKTLYFDLKTDKQGYFEVLILSYQDEITDGKLVNGKVFSYAVLNNETVLNDRLGVCTHPQRGYYSEKCIDLMAIVGAKYMRFGMVLEFLEKEDGTFKFEENTLEILNNAREKGFRFVCIFRDKTPPLTEDRKEKFLKYSRFLLDEYKGVIDKVEFWNEWTNGTGTHFQYQKEQTAENYTKFIGSVYPTLKAEYPDVEFIGLGGENPQRFREHIIDMYKAGAGKYMDAISLHPYRQPVSPDSRIEKVHNMNMGEQVLDIVEISKKYNGPGKVYVTEIGYPSHLLNWGVNDYIQARYIVETLGVLLASNVVEQIDWYNLYNMLSKQPDRTYRNSSEYSQVHFGLFNAEQSNFAVKPAAIAFRFFAKITKGFAKGKIIDNKDGLVCLTMTGENGGELNILWNNYNLVNYKVEENHIVYDLMGNEVVHKGEIKLGREPVYVLKSELKAAMN